MEYGSNLIYGLSIAVQPANLLFCLLGVLIGTLVGVLPGLGANAALSLLLPITFKLPPVSAVIMLAGIYYGASYGGSTTSILVNIPGEAASVITCLDGHQMALKGRAGPALGIAAFGSFIAGTFGVIMLMLMAPTLAGFALKFGPPEYCSLMAMSLCLVTYLAGESMLKSLIMAGIGLFLGVVGMDSQTGKVRFDYGIPYFTDGIPLVPVVMGLFGISEVLKDIGSHERHSVLASRIKGFLPNLQDWKDSAFPMVRGSLIGFFMGLIPGIGLTTPTFIAYGIEKKISRHPEKFGTGLIEGVASPEACNNATASGFFIPLLSLGIPGSAAMALFLGALMIYGLEPGPLLIKNHPDVFWGVVASMYLGNVMLLILNLPLIPLWVKVLKIPYSFLFPWILLFCIIGAYSLNNRAGDVVVMITCGVIGYLFRKFRYEIPPLILAFVLGPMLEMEMRRSLSLSRGSFSIFFTRPISVLFTLIALAVLLTPLIRKTVFNRKP
ncbi:MAG: tripartite tricarboxylate transporter permease [Pseudomonadota bacterium]